MIIGGIRVDMIHLSGFRLNKFDAPYNITRRDLMGSLL